MKLRALFHKVTRNISQKFLFAALPIIFAAMLALTFISISSFRLLFERKVSELTYGELSQSANQLDTLFADMIKLSNIISEDETIVNALKNADGDSFDKNYHLKSFSEYRNIDYQRMSQIELRLTSLKNAFFFNYEANVVLYSVDGICGGTLFDSRNSRDIMLQYGTSISKQPWLANLSTAPGGLLFLPPIQYERDSQARIFLPLAKAIYGTYNRNLIGLAIINLDVTNLDSLVSTTAGRNFYLFSEMENTAPIYMCETIPLAPDTIQMNSKSGGYSILQADANKFLVNSYPLPRYRLRLVSAIDYSAVYSEMTAIQNRIMFWMLVIFVLVFFLLYLYTTHLTQPLSRLLRRLQARKVGPYSLTGTLPHRSDDMVELTHSIEQLFTEIEQLTSKVLDNQRLAYEFQYEMLKAQIRPHFIFNTLNVIKWTALIDGSERVADMVADLGLLLEASINRGEEKIPIREELDLIRSYLNIQNARFEGRFTLTVALDPALAECRILKLILQPIVENSINHGFLQVNPGNIRIHVAADGNDILLGVTDDGVGIPPEKLCTLLSPSTFKEGGFNGIGIRNIHERLKLQYGEPYGLTICSNEKGTCVTVRIPKEV